MSTDGRIRRAERRLAQSPPCSEERREATRDLLVEKQRAGVELGFMDKLFWALLREREDDRG